MQNSTEKSTLQYRPTGQIDNLVQRAKRAPGIRDKSLALIPGRLMLALQADGWIIRSNIVWHKPNAMPSSVRDRPANAHEYIILMSKSPKYYYDNDAVKVPASTERRNKFTDNGRDKQRGYSRRHAGFNGRYAEKLSREGVPTTRNLRDVWTVATANFPEAHFATFPAELIRPCILAGCPEGGLVLDPFVGSGTTVKVAQDLGRRGVGLELNPAYIAMAKRRTAQMSLAL